MASRRSRTRTSKTRSRAADHAAEPSLAVDERALAEVEFHRHAFVLAPAFTGGESALYTVLHHEPGRRVTLLCSCAQAPPGSRRCVHSDRLGRIHELLVQRAGRTPPSEHLQASLWMRLLLAIAEHDDVPMASAQLTRTAEGVSIRASDGVERALYRAPGERADRLCERLGWRADGAGRGKRTRAHLLEQLAQFMESPYEKQLRELGHATEQQVLERGVWHRLAYHGYREHHGATLETEARVHPDTGDVRVVVHDRESGPLLEVAVARGAVRSALRVLREAPCRGPVAIEPAALEPRVRFVALDGAVQAEPLVELAGGDARPLAERFYYDGDGSAAYLPEDRRLVELAPPGPIAAALGLVGARTLTPEEVPAVLDAIADVEAVREREPEHPAARELVGKSPVVTINRIEFLAHALGRDWCWLCVSYGAGKSRVSLAEVLAARRAQKRFIDTGDGWIDVEDPVFAAVDAIAARQGADSADSVDKGPADSTDERMALSRMELIRLAVSGARSLEVMCTGPEAGALERLFAVTPVRPLEPIRGLGSDLRAYQVRGVEWLLFLYDNRFGGLLCDDMGLGKTHQVMALMLAMREQRRAEGRFLVVCPTTVLSHWQRVLARFAPGLSAAVFHGSARDLEHALATGQVLITSYGVLRNDIEALARVEFSLAVFDEAQYLKNPDTHAHQAARRVQADMRLGLSGTPVENTLMDLHALLQLCLPGYLDQAAGFRARFAEPIETRGSEPARAQLRRLIAPFVLRRTKGTVLDQLPPKIEDLRLCRLSEEQSALYREAVRTRGKSLREMLADPGARVPYVHIFALLALLKQICCHPVLVIGDGKDTKKAADNYHRHQSGKWDLFVELLDECLGSGQKVVVYSQFLGMIRIMARHLESRGVGYARLTGQTRDRGQVIARFADDPECRVFLASLQAGGVGIDLVAASAVIHYDRWWNAAREDQATDRVHRMGQTRGVHVLKLITEGTLEEKIAALIEKRRALMNAVVAEDEQSAVKSFTRDELLELLHFDGE